MDILLSQAAPIPLHALAAILALILGGIQLVMKKGTALHRLLGWLWVSLMMLIALSSFFIHELKLWGNYSPIHLLSIWTIFSVVMAIYYARMRNIKRHKQIMIALYGFALVLTGLFTLAPGRVMHSVIFG